MKIDQEFENHLIPLSDSELSHLTEQICADGCRDPIVVWKGHDIIVDGHNRFKICNERDIEFDYVEQEFADRGEVLEWIDRNQISRRNLSPGDFKIVSGRIYNRRKESIGGDRKSSGQVDHMPKTPAKTAKKVAEELETSEKSIRRNGTRAAVHDKLLEAGEKEAAEKVKKVPQEVIDKVKDKPAKTIAKEVKAEKELDWKHYRAKAVKTAEALMRAIDDLQREKKSSIHATALKHTQDAWEVLKKW